MRRCRPDLHERGPLAGAKCKLGFPALTGGVTKSASFDTSGLPSQDTFSLSVVVTGIKISSKSVSKPLTLVDLGTGVRNSSLL